MKKLGRYLLEDKICDEPSLEKALQEQLRLKQNRVFKPLGSILKESKGVAAKHLEKSLLRMHFDLLSASSFFNDISNSSIKKILSFAEQKVFPEETALFREGDPPDCLHIVMSGEVKIFVTLPDGTENTVAIIRNGEVFGEIALVAEEPRKTSAKTITPTSLLSLSKKDFFKLYTHSSEISMAFLKVYANRLMQKDEEIVKAGKRERAYQQFVSEHDALPLPEIVGQTRVINKLREKIDETSKNTSPVLIYGEPGTEVLVAAGDIHKKSFHAAAPLLSMDAENIALEGYGSIIEADSGSLQLEIAQDSILFGYEGKPFSFSKARGLGLLQICSQGTVIIKNIEHLTQGVQERLLHYLRTNTFLTVGGQKPIKSNARIIATTSKDLDALSAEGIFNKDLLEILQSNQLTIPPLKKRKSDLRLLVDFIIVMECFKTPDRKIIKGVSPEAYQRIMEYDWPGNTDELQIVVRRAINLAHGDYLMLEDVFIGITPLEGRHTLNLLQFDKVKKFFSSRAYPGRLQAVMAIVFSLIFLMAFIGNQEADRNISLLLVWGLWEPMLVISWLFGARIWCAVCPMGAVNDLLNRIGKKKLKVPIFIHDYGAYFGALGLAIIILAEEATRMQYSPLATGYLLFAIAFFAILSGILFERRMWCRYLCPLGKLGAIYSGCSFVELRANSGICNSTCKTNECYKGDGKIPGCPLYQGLFSQISNQNCILCGNCIKACPNDSPVFNLRIPGHELWASFMPEKVTVVFVPVILGTQIFRGLEHTPIMHGFASGMLSRWLFFAILLVLTTALSFVYLRAAGSVAFGKLKNPAIIKGDLFIHAIIPLAFAQEIVYQLNPLLTRLGHFLPTLGRQFGVDLEFWGFAYLHDSIKPWQVLFLLLGMAVSMIFLKILIRNHQERERGRLKLRRLRYLPIVFLGCVYISMFIFQ